MDNAILRCHECGRHFFSWKKLTAHLIKKHGYVIAIEGNGDEKQD